MTSRRTLLLGAAGSVLGALAVRMRHSDRNVVDSINGVPVAHDNDRGTVLDVASADHVTAADHHHHHCCSVHGMAGSRLRPARLVGRAHER